MENEMVSPKRLLFRRLISACREKGLNDDETTLIWLIASTKKSRDKYGKLEALEVAIKETKKSATRDDVIRNVSNAMGLKP